MNIGEELFIDSCSSGYIIRICYLFDIITKAVWPRWVATEDDIWFLLGIEISHIVR